MTSTNLFEVASTLIYNVGDRNIKHLVSYCGSPEEIFKTSKSKLSKVPGIGPTTIDAIVNGDSLKQAEKVLLNCEKAGFEILYYTNTNYPQRLKQIADAPPILYSQGKNELNATKTIAIVGTRNATNYGKHTTEDIIQQLAPHNPTIISGLAYGIDITAHKAALEVGIPTIGILAGGLDKIYPATHKKTAEKMMEHGGILSENPPGTKPDAHLFPARNRIIAGMSDATIVVEAAAKGGALITAEIAYSYEKTLFAVPGNLGNKYSEGCNKLIRNQKANIYSDIESLEYLLGWDKSNESGKKEALDLSVFEPNEQTIIKLLLEAEDGIQIDELAWKSQTNINETATILLTLEFKGVVKTLPGKRYCIKI